MSQVKKATLKPTMLRLLLTLGLFSIVGLTAAGFILTQQKLSAYAIEVSHKKVDASGSRESVQTLQSIQQELTARQSTVDKVKNIKHASDLPQFKAIDDIRNHAKANELSISNITFASANVGTTAGAAATPAAPVTPATGAATPATTSGDGIDISFALGGGTVNVTNFVQFLYDIEHSTPKMQVQGINVSGGGDKDHIKVETMTVKMFTKLPGQG